MTGLAIALIAVILELSAIGYVASTDESLTSMAFSLIIGAIAFWLGVRMARAGDAEIGRAS